MKKILLLFLFVTTIMSCGQSQNEGKIIEIQEVSPGKFVVKDERFSGSAESWVSCYYLNGSQKTIGLSQAEQLMNQIPPSPPNSPVFVNYDGGNNRGGISFSDLLLYHMMFSGFGGNNYHTEVIHRYPAYQTTIHKTVNINYANRYNSRWSKAAFYRSSQTAYTNRRSPVVRPVVNVKRPNYTPPTATNRFRSFAVKKSSPSQPSRPSYSPPKSSSSSSSRSSFRLFKRRKW